MNSVSHQRFTDWELIVIADGCQRTMDILTTEYGYLLPRLSAYLIEKQKTFSGRVRNAGIAKATGEWITYLDTDDYWGEHHLQILADGIKKHPSANWLYYNDWTPSGENKFRQRAVNIERKGHHGTANVTYRRSLNVLWKDETYDHDWHFISELKRHGGAFPCKTPEYFVCHVPGKFDV